MDSTRQLKISRLLQKELAIVFQREALTVCKGAIVTVTRVRVSPDMSVARVYISVFAPGKDVNDVYEHINLQAKRIKAFVASEVRKQLRIMPELSFFIDDSLDYLENIENLLK